MGETIAVVVVSLLLIVLFAAYPGLLTLTLIAMVVIPVATWIVWSIRRSDDYLTNETASGLTAAYLAVINPLRIRFGRAPIWLVPDLDYTDRGRLQQANRLYLEVKDALKHCPLTAVKQAAFQRQALNVPANVVAALWRLMRLKRMAQAISNPSGRSRQNLKEIAEMQHQITQAIEQALEVLASIPIALMKVELARNDIALDQLFAGLGETNKRLRDLSASYSELREARL